MKQLLILLGFLVLAAPAFAQDAPEEEKAAQAQEKPVLDPDFEQRLNLAEKMHDIWPIRPRVEDALDMTAESLPEAERAEFKAHMRKVIKYDQLEEESIEAMARIYTVEELQAMLDFYSSKEGRSVSAKTSEYMEALEPAIIKMLDGALMSVRTGSSPDGFYQQQ
ncbi:MAG: DUF2059 domain-containing protein [Rhodospirillales bacterium]|nr:DUF2059 domain-containing protein [Alphaproteobacteria bacterium]USO03023.1 MAG: DUF2059 domain-containing protein [Rhodospirillales bacterium]